MNKKRRHELKMLKYKKRLKKIGALTCQNLATPKGIDENGVTYNYTSFRYHSAPCSCYVCSNKKYNRSKSKVMIDIDLG